MTNYKLIRKKRKSIGIYIKNAQVEVRAPLKYPEKEIDKFVHEKEDWIIEKLNLQQQRCEVSYGSFILLLGKEYPIMEHDIKIAEFDGSAFKIPQGLASEEIKNACTTIYRAQAKIIIQQRVNHHADIMQVAPKSVKINAAKTRWGSCSNRGSLNFSWRLIMADHDTIDYVIIHELAHLREMNHSPRFWIIVEKFAPDYKKSKEHLKKLQNALLWKIGDC